jgi:hypothetical protein
MEPRTKGLHGEALRGPFHQALGLADVSDGGPLEQRDQRAAADSLDHIRVQKALVEAGALAEVRHAFDAVVIVCHQHDRGRVSLAPPFELE